MLGLLPHFTPLLDIFFLLAKDLLDERRSKQEIYSDFSKLKENKTRAKPHLKQVKPHLTSEKHFYFLNNALIFSSSVLVKAPQNIL